MKTQDEVLATNLFDAFRRFVKVRPKVGVSEHLEAFQLYGDIYYEFYQYADTSRLPNADK